MSAPSEGTVAPSTPTAPPAATGTPSANSSSQSAGKLASSGLIQPNEVHLSVKLPEAAVVYVNGNKTSSTGDIRHFVSNNLRENEAYRFEVKAILTKEDGSEVVQNKTVVVNSGNGEEIVFDMLKADDPIETVLTLNVPEDAQAWDDYKIVVTHKGQTKEKTIRLIGGDKLEITFNFEDEQVLNKVASN